MRTLHSPSRRSFLSRVGGGGLIVGAGMIFGANGGAAQQKGQADTRQMVVDADPRDPARPPSTTRPRRPASPSRRADADAGPSSDATGLGRTSTATTSSEPLDRFIVCPGHPRCPS